MVAWNNYNRTLSVYRNRSSRPIRKLPHVARRFKKTVRKAKNKTTVSILSIKAENFITKCILTACLKLKL